MAWCFENQSDDFTRAVLSKLDRDEADVPSLWPLEVANALLVAERRGKISRAETAEFAAILSGLQIWVVEDTHEHALNSILSLARAQNLSAYDAAYLELALREGLPLASRDKALRRAAERTGVRLLRE